MLRSKSEESKKSRSTTRICGASLVAVALVGLHAKAAEAAAPLDGRWAGSVSDCSTNHHIGSYQDNRIQAWNPYGGSNGRGAWVDYGWMEWRYSNDGECNGYQWVRFHIDKELDIFNGGWLDMEQCNMSSDHLNSFNCNFPEIAPQVVDTTVEGGTWSVTASKLLSGTYDGGLIYSPHNQSCVELASGALEFTWNAYSGTDISGYICA
jgi:hypothetical protein